MYFLVTSPIEEQETIILLNTFEIREGFFRFSTNRLLDWKRLLRRVGGEGSLLDIERNILGKRVLGWSCRVPIKFLSRTTFGIKIPRAKMSDERKAILRRQLTK